MLLRYDLMSFNSLLLSFSYFAVRQAAVFQHNNSDKAHVCYQADTTRPHTQTRVTLTPDSQSDLSQWRVPATRVLNFHYHMVNVANSCSLVRFRHQNLDPTSSFAAVIITTATRGHHLTVCCLHKPPIQPFFW